MIERRQDGCADGPFASPAARPTSAMTNRAPLEDVSDPVPRVAARTGSPNRLGVLATWGGAAVFAGSLLSFGIVYQADTWGFGASGGAVWPAMAVNLTLFGVFAGHHSLLARSPVKRYLAERLPEAAGRTAYVWAASILFAVLALTWRPLPGHLYQVGAPGSWAFLAVQAAGLCLILWSVSQIDLGELAGVDGHALARTLSPERETRSPITSQGPYGVVRHPIYLGWVLLVAAHPHMTASRLLFVALSVGYLATASRWEEASLLREHGRSYRDYRKRVRWRILPGVY